MDHLGLTDRGPNRDPWEEAVSEVSPHEGLSMTSPDADVGEEHFKPVGTMVILAMFVAAMVLLWLSVYLILLSRGVTT